MKVSWNSFTVWVGCWLLCCGDEALPAIYAPCNSVQLSILLLNHSSTLQLKLASKLAGFFMGDGLEQMEFCIPPCNWFLQKYSFQQSRFKARLYCFWEEAGLCLCAMLWLLVIQVPGIMKRHIWRAAAGGFLVPPSMLQSIVSPFHWLLASLILTASAIWKLVGVLRSKRSQSCQLLHTSKTRKHPAYCNRQRPMIKNVLFN